jgi:hypothetical protein
MKRTFSLLLAVILSVLCLVSCGESENAYDLYNKAIKAAENGMEATITMTINVQGQKIETKMDIKASKEAYEIAMNVEGMDVVDAICDAGFTADGNGVVKAEEQPVINKVTIRKEAKSVTE